MTTALSNPLARIAGSFASWFLFSLCMLLLLQGMFAVLALGGSCASGGPYSIEVECPENVVLFVPLSIFGGLASVGIALFVARGFGTSLIELAWPILFGSLGGGFLWAFFASGDIVGLIIGVLFETMALVPLVLSLRSNASGVFLGAVSVRGEPFYVKRMDRYSFFRVSQSPVDEPPHPTALDWALSLGVWSIAVLLGYLAARGLWAS
jgi:hypothetical protein